MLKRLHKLNGGGMQAFSRALLVVWGVCLMVATTVAAQEAAPPVAQPVVQPAIEPRTVTVTPFVSVSFGTSNDLGSSLGLGAAVEYDFTRNFGAEFEYAYVFDVAGDDENLDFHLMNISGSLLYHFNVPRMPRLAPYALLGLGWEDSNPEVQNPDPLVLYPSDSTEIAWHFGGGAKYALNERLVLRADLRRFQVNDLAPDHWRFYGGVTFWIKRN